MPETAPTARLFSELHTPESRLIRCTEAPDIDSLREGDMVICEDDWGIEGYVEQCRAKGVHVRVGAFRYETEKVVQRRNRRGVQPDYPEVLLPSSRNLAPPGEYSDAEVADASTAAFAITWDALSAEVSDAAYEAASNHVPDDLAAFLPYPTVNPAQVQAAPYIMGDRPVMIVAPTGAGKTVVGMMAAIKEIKRNGKKAAWLVPQRTLTAELDRDLQKWRDMGVKVVSLSGETATDARKTKEADLWVATTEKFEALCRASSMKEAVSGIGTVIVDEIHLLGEPSRGPVLESLLARIRQETSGVRLVGLSATAANADQVAEWLNADLVEITWRPTRLTNQLLTIPNSSTRDEEATIRNEALVALVEETAAQDGSTLVFCGSKNNVRSSALALAASRGVREARTTPASDVDGVAEVCARAGVGLHYSDWPQKKVAERQFRDREINVLVATSTLAAGVNTPARTVVVRDTSIGPQPMEVSMIQQMFGRAGRAGKEKEGWSFLLTQSAELGKWRKRLAAGYSIVSGILDTLSDHLLGEVVQKNVRSLAEAEKWWTSTLAYHQGNSEIAAIHEARDYLVQWRFIETEDVDGAEMWKPTRLGGVTSKMMVSVRDAAGLLATLARTPLPKNSGHAEWVLAETLASAVYAFQNAPDAPGGDQARAVRAAISAQGYVSRLEGQRTSNARDNIPGPEVVKAGLLLLLHSPHAFLGSGRQVAGINRNLLNPAIYDSSRYLAWLAALGPLGSVPSWASLVAADVAQRITHYRFRPSRGDGRLLRLATEASRGGASSMSDVWRDVRTNACATPRTWLKKTTMPAGSGDLGKNLVALSGTSARATLYAPQEGQTYWRRVTVASADRSAPLALFGDRGDWDATDWLEEFAKSQH